MTLSVQVEYFQGTKALYFPTGKYFLTRRQLSYPAVRITHIDFGLLILGTYLTPDDHVTRLMSGAYGEIVLN